MSNKTTVHQSQVLWCLERSLDVLTTCGQQWNCEKWKGEANSGDKYITKKDTIDREQYIYS